MPKRSRPRRVVRQRVVPAVLTALALAGTLGCGSGEVDATLTSGTETPRGPSGAATSSTPPSTPDRTAARPGPLHVDGRRLVDAQGASFLWLGDTAWNITSLTREEVDRYLDTRRDQGFTVIQAVAVFRRPDALADAYGRLPFDGDVSRLRTTPGARPEAADEYDYWDHVDYIVRGIQARGMTAALIPAWSVNHAGATLTAGNARGYGEFLGKRYGAAGVVWVLGGDDQNPHPDIWPQLAEGIRAGVTAPLDGGPTPPAGSPTAPGNAASQVATGTRTTQDKPLITYHPAGMKKPSYAYGDADFAMIQTGHCNRQGHTSLMADSYREANKPILDAEPLYEDHPWCWKQDMGYARTDEVRRTMYWSVFDGGFGVTYGNHSVWQFYVPGKGEGFAFPRLGWQEALDRPAARQFRHLGTLLRARPDDQRVPDDRLLLDGVKGGWERRTAVRDGSGRWAMAYLPVGGSVRLDLAKVSGERVRVSWFDPRTGEMVDGGERSDAEAGTLSPPERAGAPDDKQDWVLIVDSA